MKLINTFMYTHLLNLKHLYRNVEKLKVGFCKVKQQHFSSFIDFEQIKIQMLERKLKKYFEG